MLGIITYIPRLIWWAIPFTNSKPPWYKEPREFHSQYFVAKIMYQPFKSKKAMEKEWYKIFGKKGEHLTSKIYGDFTVAEFLDYMDQDVFDNMHNFDGFMERIVVTVERGWRPGMHIRSWMISGEAMELLNNSDYFFAMNQQEWTEGIYSGIRNAKKKEVFDLGKKAIIGLLIARGEINSQDCDDCGNSLEKTLKWNGHCSNCGHYVVDDDEIDDEIEKIQKAA